jgi:DNA-binding NarL/FixJ family response regulator
MITILIVDDHAIVREGLQRIVADTADMTVGGEASSGAEALAILQTSRWDVVVLDLSLPDRDGLTLLQHIIALPHAPPVLVLTIHDERHYGPRLLRMGAAGYIMKDASPHELVTALRRIAHGRKYVSPTLAEYLVDETATPADQPRHTLLSEREFQILCLLASGLPISAIADRLVISAPTVSTHRARILAKMGLRTNADLIQYAIWHHLVPWTPDAIRP